MLELKSSKKRGKLSYNFRKYFILPIKVLRMSLVDTIRQDGIEHAGYLAFLSIFSLFPFLIFLISIVGKLGGDTIGAKAIVAVINSLPQEAASSLLPRIEEIISGPPQSFLTIAIIGVIWTASSSVEGLRTILNRAYRVELPPPYLLRRLISIAEFFILTFSITAVIMIFVVVPSFFKNNEFEIFLKILENKHFPKLTSFTLFLFLFGATSLLYYAIPNVKQKITKTFPGAVLTVCLWYITQKCFLYYINQFHQFSFIYGHLAGIMIYLMFFYMVNLIFIFGAQFNHHLNRVYQTFLR
jgi:membrane protein